MSSQVAANVGNAEGTLGDGGSTSNEDRRTAEIRASLEQGRTAFHAMLTSLTDGDLIRRTGDSGWTVGEVIAHVVNSIERVPALIRSLRRGQDYVNYPLPIFERVKRVYTWWLARGVTRDAHLRHFEAAFPPVLALLDTIQEGEWARAGHAYGEGRWTVESAFRHQAEHIADHIEQIRRLSAGVDNDLYDQLADGWWDHNGVLNVLKGSVNPWRVPYFQRILNGLHLAGGENEALDLGCGGGLLAEEFAALGFAVTGVDPSEKSLDVARAHAAQQALQINYQLGYGDRLPFESETFEIVYCCDVLEHIRNWDAVIGEIARVLKPHGVFLYDTINRTALSKILAINVAQEWVLTRFLPPRLHAWNMFIKPAELRASIERHGLRNQDIRGTKLMVNPVRMLQATRAYRTRRISATEFGRRIGFREGSNLSVSYMGYALKR